MVTDRDALEDAASGFPPAMFVAPYCTRVSVASHRRANVGNMEGGDLRQVLDDRLSEGIGRERFR
ncbi:MAG: hypothetical protein HY650_01285 [Acidobacteria bacterium]|nr:hypothetical protein [Acidobacteriota bacterium]